MKCYQTFFYLVLTNIKTLSIRIYSFIQLISLKLRNALKGHCFLDRCYHFTTNFLISLLHPHLFFQHVVTLLAPCQLLQISLFPLFLNNASQVFVWSKHTFVQHLTISVLSEVCAGWRIAQRFNTCNFVLVLFVTWFVSCTC